MKQLILDRRYAPLQPTLMRQHIEALQKGQSSYYLLPTQTLLEQARTLYYQETGAQVLFDRTFLTFDDIVKLMLERAGCDCYLIESAAQNVIITRILHDLIEKKRLHYLQQIATSVGLSTKLVNLIGELKRGACRSDDFKYNLNPSTELERKDYDLALIYREYEAFLKQHRLYDIEAMYFKAIDICSELPNIFGPADQIIIAGFSLTPLKMALVKLLSQLFTTSHVYLHYDTQRPTLFYQSRAAKEQLEALKFQIRKVSYNDAETSLGDAVFNEQGLKLTGHELALHKWQCWSQRQEVREIARQIKCLNLRAGVPLDQIVVVTRHVESYANVVRTEFERAQIPLQTSGLRRLTMFAPTRRLLNLVALMTREWEADIFLEVMTDRGISWPITIQAPLIEHFLRETTENGPMYVWVEACQRQLHYWHTRQQLADHEGDLELMELAKLKQHDLQLVRDGLNAMESLWKSCFPEEGSFSDFSQGLRQLAKLLQLDVALTNSTPAYSQTQIEESFLVWQLVLKCLNEQEQHAQDWLDFALNRTQFYALLKDILHATTLPDPKALVGGVKLLSPWHLSGQDYAVVFAMGCNEGVFPQPYQPDWFYDEKERSILRRQGLPFLEARYYQAQEKMFFYNVVAAAQQKLYLSYIQQSYREQNLMPSPFLLELASADTWQENQTWVPSTALPQARQQAVHEAEEQAIASSHNLWNELDESIKERLFIERQREENASSIYNGCLNDKSLQIQLSKRYGTQAVFSPSMFEQYGRCPFAFYMQRVLRVVPFEGLDTELTPLVQGNTLHRVLAQFLQGKQGKLEVSARSNYLSELDSLLMRILQDYQQEMTSAGALWTDLEYDRLQQTLRQWLDYEIDYQQGVQLRPTLFEYEFGQKDAPFILNVSEDSLQLHGYIDRVDIDAQSFTVYDYKTGQPANLQSVLEGYAFQMPIYLLVMKQLYPDHQALGAGYYHLGKPVNRNHGMWRSTKLEEVIISSRIADQLEEAAWEEALSSVQTTLFKYRRQMQTGDYTLRPRVPCPSYCAYRLLCRMTPQLQIRINRGEEVQHELY